VVSTDEGFSTGIVSIKLLSAADGFTAVEMSADFDNLNGC
jgi:hypothetical protein